MTSINQIAGVERTFWNEADPFRAFFRAPVRTRQSNDQSTRVRAATWSPAVSLREDDDRYVVTVEIAGVKKEDVSIECHDSVLSIKGEKRDEHEDGEGKLHYFERVYGEFARKFRMPADTSGDIDASLRDGVLTVSLKKQEEKMPKVVAIQD
ncbi:MAG: Hsp20/alpha crystallin family protein [Myxococcota bacterium]|jgi:HSP20 family protein